jgi:hypothetical protein
MQLDPIVGGYKLPLSQYMCIGLVVACSFQQKYDFSQVLLQRPADILPTPAPPITIACRGSYMLGTIYNCVVVQRYVGSVSSELEWQGLEPTRV